MPGILDRSIIDEVVTVGKQLTGGDTFNAIAGALAGYNSAWAPDAAALVVRKPFKGRTFVRASMLLPYVAPVVAVTFVWQIMLNPEGRRAEFEALGKRILGPTRIGAHGTPIFFVHPKDMGGMLTEIMETPREDAHWSN